MIDLLKQNFTLETNRLTMLPSASTLTQQLRQQLPDLARCVWLEETNSTNTVVLEHLRTSPDHLPIMIGAHTQTSGRGRGGKTFTSKPGQQLLFTLGLGVTIDTKLIPSLAIIIGLLSCQSLRKFCSPSLADSLQIKWPNDLWWQGAKLAGILIETVSLAKTPQNSKNHLGLAIGIGINIKGAEQLSSELQRPIASLEQCLPHFTTSFDASTLVSNLCRSWLNFFQASLSNQDIISLLKTYSIYDGLKDKPVKVTHADQILHRGLAQGIDELGRLLLKEKDLITPIMAGEVSIQLNEALS